VRHRVKGGRGAHGRGAGRRRQGRSPVAGRREASRKMRSSVGEMWDGGCSDARSGRRRGVGRAAQGRLVGMEEAGAWGQAARGWTGGWWGVGRAGGTRRVRRRCRVGRGHTWLGWTVGSITLGNNSGVVSISIYTTRLFSAYAEREYELSRPPCAKKLRKKRKLGHIRILWICSINQCSYNNLSIQLQRSQYLICNIFNVTSIFLTLWMIARWQSKYLELQCSGAPFGEAPAQPGGGTDPRWWQPFRPRGSSGHRWARDARCGGWSMRCGTLEEWGVGPLAPARAINSHGLRFYSGWVVRDPVRTGGSGGRAILKLHLCSAYA
jgi:hypothetical protein